MKWHKLLSAERFEPEGAGTKPPRPINKKPTQFQDDVQRVLSCTAFRRLQGKTQVYPFPSKDSLRTRLTHSLEVAHAAHVIADHVGTKILSEHPKLEKSHGVTVTDISDIAAAAAYSHDLGNPPFGHIGEFAIQSWFTEKFPKERGKKTKRVFATKTQLSDFTKFDGNAQGFRILTRLQGWSNEGGLQLTYAVLGAFSKYPYSSDMKPKTKKKYGFPQDDAHNAKRIFGKKLGLVQVKGKGSSVEYCRHPLAYITEAADDICYLTTDIEDGVRNKLVKFKEVEELLTTISQHGKYARRYEQILHKPTSDKIKYLRATAIRSLKYQAAQTFLDNYKEIMRGEFSGSLLENCHMKNECQHIRDICHKEIYTDRDKMEIEAAGFKIIRGLLDIYADMIEHLIEHGDKFEDEKHLQNIHQLLPLEFRDRLISRNRYRCYLVLLDYISGMTDRYALELYQKITGTSVSLGRML